MRPHLTNRQKVERMAEATTHLGMLRAAGFQPIGFWTQTSEVPPAAKADGLLWPGDVIDLTWDEAERAKVIAYLKAGERFMAYMGYSWCRLCALTATPRAPDDYKARDWEILGTKDLTDKVFVWPEGFVHYVEEHGVKPPLEFINHVLGRK